VTVTPGGGVEAESDGFFLPLLPFAMTAYPGCVGSIRDEEASDGFPDWNNHEQSICRLANTMTNSTIRVGEDQNQTILG